MGKYVTVEVFVLVDSENNAVASHDEAKLADLHDEEVGADASMARRIVKVLLDVEVPTVVELTGSAPLVGNGAMVVAFQ